MSKSVPPSETAPATAPKKKSLMPSSPLRRQLRSHGHALAPIVMIGKSGVTLAVRKELQKAAFDHELVKVRLLAECPSDRFAVAERLAGEPGIRIVQILGRTILVYKRHPQEPRFEGKRTAAANVAAE
jgi:RNA-binding protein